MNMKSIFAKAIFRFRERATFYLVSYPRSVYWRLLGLRLGAGTILPKVYISWPHQVSFGSNCLLEQNSYFKFDGIYHPGPKLIFGDNVFIGAGCEFNRLVPDPVNFFNTALL